VKEVAFTGTEFAVRFAERSSRLGLVRYSIGKCIQSLQIKHTLAHSRRICRGVDVDEGGNGTICEQRL
jgi:hypothetical protein